MKITFLGTSHGIAEKQRFCTSVVVTVGHRHYIIDAGAPLMTLLKNHDMAYEDVQGIFITHTHEDHFMGLVEFTFQMNAFSHFEHIRIPVFVPDAEKYQAMFQFLFGKSEFAGRLAYQVYGEGVIFDDGILKVTAIPVGHIANAHAFLLEAEGKKVVFTGDLRNDLTDYPKVIHEQECDLVVTEAAHFFLNRDYVVQCLAKSKCKAMVISHLYSGVNTDDVVAEFKEKIGSSFDIQFAYDNMVIEV